MCEAYNRGGGEKEADGERTRACMSERERVYERDGEKVREGEIEGQCVRQSI